MLSRAGPRCLHMACMLSYGQLLMACHYGLAGSKSQWNMIRSLLACLMIRRRKHKYITPVDIGSKSRIFYVLSDLIYQAAGLLHSGGTRRRCVTSLQIKKDSKTMPSGILRYFSNANEYYCHEWVP